MCSHTCIRNTHAVLQFVFQSIWEEMGRYKMSRNTPNRHLPKNAVSNMPLCIYSTSIWIFGRVVLFAFWFVGACVTHTNRHVLYCQIQFRFEFTTCCTKLFVYAFRTQTYTHTHTSTVRRCLCCGFARSGCQKFGARKVNCTKWWRMACRRDAFVRTMRAHIFRIRISLLSSVCGVCVYTKQ